MFQFVHINTKVLDRASSLHWTGSKRSFWERAPYWRLGRWSLTREGELEMEVSLLLEVGQMGITYISSNGYIGQTGEDIHRK
jgi:hypothetical protein